MGSTAHTYAPNCLLHADQNTFTRRASEASTTPPPLKAQFFYGSTLPIDDPLSPIPPPPAGPSANTKLPPRPFSIHDNAALDKAWLQLLASDLGERPTGRENSRAKAVTFGSSPAERETSGAPFLRISRLRSSHSRSPSDVSAESLRTDGERGSRPSSRRFRSDRSQSSSPSKRQEAHVTVGMSRLHVVDMPSLKMSPIYWDPVHDISSVARGTWFYKDTMYPVEPDVANQIEAGYLYIMPWTQTYVDELNVCEEVGPEAELKLVHKLWPAEQTQPDSSRPSTSRIEQEMTPEKSVTAAQDPGVRHAQIASESKAVGTLDGFDDPGRLFSKSSMIYVNAYSAQILRPNQLPSVARGRRQLAHIRKGRAIGVPVVRGFDQRSWERLHPPSRKIIISQKIQANASTFNSSTPDFQKLPPCEACLRPEERPKPTDLVFVIHGIGQKLSERMESFHFTHAINAFRRQVNVELEADTVKPWLRKEMGSVMVLPINWRSKIDVDGGESELGANRNEGDETQDYYTLSDITPGSIPAVRNLMSDVLIDIPLYLSQHKQKLLEAVTKEANRVFRLWCTHNPGFYENGKVHVLAHSLGSVMTLDILSKQPTRLPAQVDFKGTTVRSDIFEFDTKNVFFLGSPAGLFLFINRAKLRPRKGRGKPGADGQDVGPEVAGEAGAYGCLAVDNLYNVMHAIDPIAYQLNACVDVNYAASLQRAFVPSTAITWAQYFGVSKNNALAPNKVLTGLETFPIRPLVRSMPSTVELETHNFTREELVEKRMYLLNDNGQIDFTIHSQGGPLEVQYLSMLSAHSSYWVSQDFVRFLVVEIGRKPGKSETVLSMKATKKKKKRGR